MSDTRNAFAQRLRVALASANIRAAHLAERCEVSPQAVAKWTGGTAYPNSAHLMTICKMTGCSLDWLMWPQPVDIRSTDYAPNGVNVRALVRAVLDEVTP